VVKKGFGRVEVGGGNHDRKEVEEEAEIFTAGHEPECPGSKTTPV